MSESEIKKWRREWRIGIACGIEQRNDFEKHRKKEFEYEVVENKHYLKNEQPRSMNRNS